MSGRGNMFDSKKMSNQNFDCENIKEKLSKYFFIEYKSIFDALNNYAYKNYIDLSLFQTENKEKSIRDFNKQLLINLLFNYFIYKKTIIDISQKEIYYPTDFFENIDKIFKKYTFEIDENSSENNIITPEILSYVFENLLEDNKDKGAFYTPKITADYITKTALIEYLKNNFEESQHQILTEIINYQDDIKAHQRFIDENKKKINSLLNNIKILDPATGSGAFPVSVLFNILKIKEILNPNLNKFEEKKQIIENSIYGVDIEKGAIEITKLRFQLSLIANQRENDYLFQNIDYKIICGNYLIEKNIFPSIDFDIVIGNPPYLGEKNHKEIFKQIKKGYLKEYYQKNMDLFYFFLHLGLNLLKNNGILAFITTNYFITATGGRKLREDVYKKAVIKKIVNFNKLKVFDSALGQNNMITILQKSVDKNLIAEIVSVKKTGFITHSSLYLLLNSKNDDCYYYKLSNNNLFEGTEFYIRLQNTDLFTEKKETIINKIKNNYVLLKDICNINQGIISGCDKIFVLSNNQIENLNFTNDDKKILKPWFKNSDILKWTVNLISDEKIIYANKKFKNLENNILNYLLKYKTIIDNSSDNSPYLHRPRQIDFSGEKIVVPQRSKINKFAYNECDWYSSADVYYITKKSNLFYLKYVLALLNSKLYYFWLFNKGKKKGDMLELYQKPLSEIPIKNISLKEQKFLVEIVDKILLATSKEEIIKLENQIDLMIYDLYELTNDERKII